MPLMQAWYNHCKNRQNPVWRVKKGAEYVALFPQCGEIRLPFNAIKERAYE
jgi:hypothetical protein